MLRLPFFLLGFVSLPLSLISFSLPFGVVGLVAFFVADGEGVGDGLEAVTGAVMCVGEGGMSVESFGFWRMETGLASIAFPPLGELAFEIPILLIPSISLSRADFGSLMKPSLTFDWMTSSADCVFDRGRMRGRSRKEVLRGAAASVVCALDMGTLADPSITGVFGGGGGSALSVPSDTGRRFGISASSMWPEALEE